MRHKRDNFYTHVKTILNMAIKKGDSMSENGVLSARENRKIAAYVNKKKKKRARGFSEISKVAVGVASCTKFTTNLDRKQSWGEDPKGAGSRSKTPTAEQF